MGKGRRYSQEGELNYTKVFAVIIAAIVILMCIFIIKKVLTKEIQTSANESTIKDYYALYAENKWGIIDTSGNTVIEPMYQEMLIVLNNKKDVFLCTYDVNEETGEYKTKVINKDNKEIYKDYDKVEPLENYDTSGNMWYEEDVFKVQKDGKFGIINIDGEEILKPEYDQISTLKNLKNSIIIKQGNKNGLVNTSGSIIINPEYVEIQKFDDDYKHGYIVIDSDNKYGLISYAGSKILDTKYEKIVQVYGENNFLVEEDGKQKLIDLNGEVIIESGFDKITQINSDGVVFTKDGKYGFMDLEGNVKIQAQYSDLKELNTGVLRAKKDDKYGLIDLDNVEKISIKYKDIYYESSANFYVAETDDYNSEIIDTDFNVKLNGIISELNKEAGYIKLKLSDDYKYYNFKFEEKSIKEILASNKIFVSKKDGKYGFVDEDENVVVDYIYDEAMEENIYGFAAIKKDNLWGAINEDGKIVIEPKYNLDDNLVIDFIGKWHLGQDLNMNYYCEK